MKECIRCGDTEKEIQNKGIKSCYVGRGSYKRHDYSKPMELPVDGLFFKKKLGK